MCICPKHLTLSVHLIITNEDFTKCYTFVTLYKCYTKGSLLEGITYIQKIAIFELMLY